jgi:hypothetical protein
VRLSSLSSSFPHPATLLTPVCQALLFQSSILSKVSPDLKKTEKKETTTRASDPSISLHGYIFGHTEGSTSSRTKRNNTDTNTNTTTPSLRFIKGPKTPAGAMSSLSCLITALRYNSGSRICISTVQGGKT